MGLLSQPRSYKRRRRGSGVGLIVMTILCGGIIRGMEHSFVDGRLYLRREPEEREPLLRRLRKIEGQVRGLRKMLEEDRYCLDEVQQTKAITAGVREVALMVMAQHLAAGIEFAIESKDRDAALQDLMTVLRGAMSQ
jgi:DNA-binding FrmR family transcriptional regulator